MGKKRQPISLVAIETARNTGVLIPYLANRVDELPGVSEGWITSEEREAGTVLGVQRQRQEAERRNRQAERRREEQERAAEASAKRRSAPPEPTWKSHPATEKQIAALVRLGFTGGTAGLTKGEASRLLYRAKRNQARAAELVAQANQEHIGIVADILLDQAGEIEEHKFLW